MHVVWGAYGMKTLLAKVQTIAANTTAFEGISNRRWNTNWDWWENSFIYFTCPYSLSLSPFGLPTWRMYGSSRVVKSSQCVHQRRRRCAMWSSAQTRCTHLPVPMRTAWWACGDQWGASRRTTQSPRASIGTQCRMPAGKKKAGVLRFAVWRWRKVQFFLFVFILLFLLPHLTGAIGWPRQRVVTTALRFGTWTVTHPEPSTHCEPRTRDTCDGAWVRCVAPLSRIELTFLFHFIFISLMACFAPPIEYFELKYNFLESRCLFHWPSLLFEDHPAYLELFSESGLEHAPVGIKSAFHTLHHLRGALTHNLRLVTLGTTERAMAGVGGRRRLVVLLVPPFALAKVLRKMVVSARIDTKYDADDCD